MSSSELYNKLCETNEMMFSLQHRLDEYIEKYQKGELALSDAQAEQIIEKSKKRISDLLELVTNIRKDMYTMDRLEKKKAADDSVLRTRMGEAPTNLNEIGAVISSNAEESHLIMEKKSAEELENDKMEMLKKLREKVRNNEMSLTEASNINSRINSSYNFYNQEDEISKKYA